MKKLTTLAETSVKRLIPECLLRPLTVMLFLLVTSTSYAADVDILIVGENTLKASEIRTQLQSILGGAGVGTVNVVLENTDPTYTGRNLATWYHNTAIDNEVLHQARLSNLRGQAGTVWDYVILLEDRATIEKYPGQYCVGVSDIVKEVKRGTAEVVLMVHWPTTVTTERVKTVDYYREVTYRVGNSLGLKVAPAGMAWNTAGRPSGTTQKDKDAAYIAAASLYSQIWNKSAATSNTYSFTGSATLAQTAWTTVTSNSGVSQYSGAFTAPNGIYNMKKELRREAGLETYFDSSSEVIIQGQFLLMLNSIGVRVGSPVIARMVRPMFPIEGGANQPYATEWYGPEIAYGTDIFGVYSNVDNDLINDAKSYAQYVSSGYPNRRHMPQWLMFNQFRRDNSYSLCQNGGGGHYTSESFRMRTAHMYTLATSRCPIPSPNGYGNEMWDAVRIGYETAWRMATLQGRAPGFSVQPSSFARLTVDPNGSEAMKVCFMYPPTHDVTVTVFTDKAFASVSPQTLTFTPTNYSVPQVVTVSVAADSVPTTAFNVNYAVSSSDEVYDGLTEKWDYQVNRPPIADDVIGIGAYPGRLCQVAFPSSDPDTNLLAAVDRSYMTYGTVITRQPEHGTVVKVGNSAVYTANPGYTGPDSFGWKRWDWNTTALSGEANVSITVSAAPKYDFNLLDNPTADLPLSLGWTTQSGTWFTSGLGASAIFYPEGNQNNTHRLYQDVDVSSYAQDIDDGYQLFDFSGWTRNDANRDDAHLILECRSAANQVLATIDSGRLSDGYNWLYYQKNISPPAGTVKIRVILYSKQLYTSTQGYARFDDLRLVAKSMVNNAPVADSLSGVIATSGVDNHIPLTGSDIDGDSLNYVIVDQPQHGTVTVIGSGPSVNYVPNADYLGTDSFSFIVNDGRADSVPATVSTTVVYNRGPSITLVHPTRELVTTPLNLGVLIDTTVVDDMKPAPATLTWAKLSGPGQVTFDSPNEADTAAWFSQPGIYVLQLTAFDGEFSATQTLTVDYGNYSPSGNWSPFVIAPDALVGAPGVPLNIHGVTITDVDGLPLPTSLKIRWELISGPGAVGFSDPTIREPTVTFDTAGIYTVRVSANDGEVSVYCDVMFLISGTGNYPPIAKSQTVSVNKDSTSNPITLTATDTEGNPLNYIIVSQPAHGTLNGTGANLTYTPTAGFGGNDSFTFKANDSQDSNIATVTIKVKTPPVVDAGQAQTVYVGTTPATATLNGLVSDANGDALTLGWTVSPAGPTITNATKINPTVSISTAGTYTFTLSANDGTFTASDTVVITALSIDVNNAAPVAQNASIRVGRGSANNAITLSATDAENDALTYALVSQPAKGTLSGSAPNLTYTPTPGFSGSDSFTFKASDFQRPSALATVTILINSVPVVNAGSDKAYVLSTTPVPWNPGMITTHLWLDAADEGTIIKSSTTNRVSKWNDKSGNNRYVSQATDAYRPTSGTNKINGLNAILADGNDFLVRPVTKEPWVKNPNMMIFAVTQKNPASSTVNNGVFGSKGYHKNGGLGLEFFLENSGRARFRNWYGYEPAGLAIDIVNNVPRQYTLTATTSTLGITGYDGGVRVATGSNNGGYSDIALHIFRSGDYNPSYMNGSVGELIFATGSLSPGDIQKVEGYLAHKWGLTANLSVDHPYKSAPPAVVVQSGVTASLDGTVTDPDGDPLTTQWSLVNGPANYIHNTSAVDTDASLLALGSYTYRLLAAAGSDTVSDDVVITVVANGDLVANAGADQAVTDTDGNGSESVTLNGSGSFYPLGTITNYTWKEGATQIATGVNPAVVLPVGMHTITLTVTGSNGGGTATDTVLITVNSGLPAADAGVDQTVMDTDSNGNESVTLNGTGEDRLGGVIISYVWTEGGIQLATGQTPTVTLSVGIHTITLTVTDHLGQTATDTVKMRVSTVISGGVLSKDSIVGERESSGTALGYYPNASVSIVGTSGSSGSRTDRNVVMGYRLPTLPTGTTVTGGVFNFEITGTVDAGNVNPSLDVYMLNTANPDTSGSSLFYHGASATTASAKWVGSKYIDVGTTAVTYADDQYDIQFTLTGESLALLQSIYGGDNVPEQTEVFFRFSLSKDPAMSYFSRYILDLADDESSLLIGYSSTVSSGLAAFTNWVTVGGGGGGITFSGDANGDGIADGMGWLLGAANPTQGANGLLPQPTAETNGDLTLNFKMLKSSKRGTAVLRLEHSSDLGVTDPWSSHVITIPDVSGTVGGVDFIIGPSDSPDHNQVVATLPATAANGTGKLFVRLSGALSP